MTSKKRQSRQLILDTAIHLATEKGVRHVTLDAVAQASGLSKGGVLYHFPSKMALINGLLQDMLDRGMSYKNQIQKEQPELSHLENSLHVRSRMKREISDQTFMAILAAAAEQPDLLETVRPHMQEHINNLTSNSNDPTLALIVWLASEGLRFQQLLSLTQMEPAQTEAVEERLLQMAEKLK